MSGKLESEEGGLTPGSWLASLFSDESSITLSLPDFIDDTLPSVDTSDYGSSSDILYTFKIWDHRTEGRLYMNKRDLDLYNKDREASLGQTQGRGTLEGAVYGLFAAQDILHPDGVTGAVYRKHDLTAVAATDHRGDAVFLAYTEAPGTRLSEDGTIRPSAAPGLPENLYTGQSVTSSSEGFGTITYPDYLGENGSPWIGRPLLMGSYYIRELSRSEGYELSVTGRSQADTNRSDLPFTVPEAEGQAFVKYGLSENNSMAADGTWNEFVTEYQDTSQGYRITITGYPEDAQFFRVQIKERTETIQTIAGTRKEPKVDALGNPVYQTAKGGEYKRDALGNPIEKMPERPEDQIPASETVLYRFRTAPHLQGDAQPEDLSAWDQAIDQEYLKEQTNSMLRQLGCKGAGREQGSPWVNLPLKGNRNSQAAEQILDWFTGHGFYDQGTVDEIYQREGAWYARIYYDNSGGSSAHPAVYDSPSRMLYLRKEGMLQDGSPFHYWIPRAEGSFRLDSRRAVVYEKQEIAGSAAIEDDLETLLKTVYQPLYETYQPGEPLLDENGSPIPVLEDIPVYQDMEMTYEDMILEEVQAVYNRENGTHTIFAANEVDWSKEPWPHQDTYRAVTKESTIHYQGQEMPFSQYLVQKAGASVHGYVPDPETDPDSYITFARLEYPGQDHPVQDQGTGNTPVLMLERIIRQPVKVTKDIAKTSYDGVNTYGSIHNDPMTAFLGLFTGKKKHNGTGLLEGFTFKIYLKANLEHLYADEQGNLISPYTARPEFAGEIQTVFRLPEDGTGRSLLEIRADGTCDYGKFFRALYAAEASGAEGDRLLKEFVTEYWDVKAYKEELMAAQPDMNSDKAYELAFQRALEEGNAYLKPFRGLEARLAVPWDSEQDGGADQDKTTLRCSTKNGADHYYGVSLPLPYGTYVMVEQVPEDTQLANRHYQIREPEEVEIPFISEENNAYFRYCAKDQPDELIRKYKIRFNEEDHVIQANGQDGAFEIYKYGRKGETRPDHSRSETGGELNQVIYEGSETDSGQVEIRDHVPTMTGQATAVDGKYAPMLVPWSVTEPVPGEPDDVYKAYAPEDVENTYYRSGLRIEKKDAETGENILHDGALFKLYAAKRDVKKEEDGRLTGAGNVLFGPALDAAGKPVTDLFGQEILYPRVGESNGDSQDLPVRLNQEGIPLYDESQLICQKDHQGNETGIFRAFSTEQEILAEGKTEKQVTGYLETYEPLGAGAYVLVEIQAPEGYTRSRPVAFQIYGDQVSYYEETIGEDGAWQGWQQKPASRYQYAVPLESGNTQAAETVSQIPIEDRPSRAQIHKVEDGDSLTGNQNGLLLRDDQGMEEVSGGFDTRVWVNDPGDSLIYQVWGREEKLKARGDVRDITYDSSRGQWTGYVTKAMDTYSEKILEGTEGELEAMEGVKLLYYQDGTFSGKGIQFRISVARAGLALYEAIEIEKTGPGVYKGVAAVREQGEVTRIINTNTGTHKELQIIGETDKEQPPAGQKIWDAVEVKNPPVELYYYNLKETPNRVSPDTGELQILDQRGNVLCYADYDTGMAYVYDEYGRMLAYRADHEGQKQLVRSIRQEDISGDIYKDKATKDDENGLPVSYKTWTMNREPEQWITDGVHSIERLPFGAYILQEEQVPYDQGYIQSPYQGMVLKDTDRVQKFFLQNQFTRAAFAKVDIRTQKEIQGAVMTLYQAVTDDQGVPVKEPSGLYKKGQTYCSWVSGYAYDDDGNLKTDAKGDWIPTAEPHWIDHIPVGFYVLEETSCPYDQGYVQSPSMNIDLLETGHVQSFTMEDDFTSVDIKKTDEKTGELLYEDHQALLSIYKAALDDAGNPVYEDGSPVYKEEDRLLTFPAATWQKGQEVASTGRLEPDSSGNRPIMKYDYQYQPVPGTLQGRWYYTELGTVRMEYLPPGSYVLAETENPSGYATAAPVLLRIEDKGHMEVIHQGKLEDIPLKLEVSKVNITGGKEVSGAHMSIYPVKEDGRPEKDPLVLHIPVENGAYEDREAVWVSGLDGCYTEEEGLQGLIPPGFAPGDLKPHMVEYIPEGNYILREETAPYGFLKAVDLPFTITDTGQIQKTEMIDQIPEGRLELLKTDTDHPEQKLKGVLFRLENKTLGTIWAEAETDEDGKAFFEGMPIGRMDQAGRFSPYTYICREIRAAEGYMLTLKPYEFQFPYKDQHTDTIYLDYNPANDSNRIVVEKLLGDSPEHLEGALLRLERRLPEQDSWQLTEEWITGKQPYYIKGLQAGEYRLREVKGPEGFELLAEPLYFSIEDNMTEVPRLIMRNYTSIVEIQKTRSSSGQLLGGARLELVRKSDNQVIGQWTSEAGKGMTFYGLEPGTYIIRELEAPDGYQKAPEREVEITGNQDGIQVIPFENTRITSGGGGGTVPDIRFIAFKKTDVMGHVLEGAEFTFYDPSGAVMDRAVSDKNGWIRIRKPADGTYTFRETRAPEGYALRDEVFSFTVQGDAVIKGVYEIKNEPLQTVLTKSDGVTGEPLKGARLRITSENGEKEFLAEGVTGEDGRLVLDLPEPGTYRIRELEAPEGYEIGDQDYYFTIDSQGQVQGNRTIVNFKEKKRLGIITAFYEAKGRWGTGAEVSGEPGRESGSLGSLAEAGDETPLYEAMAAAGICMAGFLVCFFFKLHHFRKKKNRSTMVLTITLLAALALAGTAGEVRAAGEPESGFYIEKERIYTGVEGVFKVPETAGFVMEDRETGESRKVFLPIIKEVSANERWEPGFELKVTVPSEPADYYLAGETAVEAGLWETEEGLLKVQDQILGLAGLSPEDYKLEHVVRDGETIRCTGRKRLCDKAAVYGGLVDIGAAEENFKEDSKEAFKEAFKERREKSLGDGLQTWAIPAALILVLLTAGLAGFGGRKHPGLLTLLMLLFLSGTLVSLACLTGISRQYRAQTAVYEELRDRVTITDSAE